MNRLKRSYAAKTLSLILSLLFLYAAAGAVCAAAYAYEQNLMYADKEPFMQKINSYAAELTATKARQYFGYVRLSEGDWKDSSYYEDEAELLRSAFSRERSNAAFEIRDEAGRIVLKNYDLTDYAYRYQRIFTEWVENVPEEETTTPPDTETTVPAEESATTPPAQDTALTTGDLKATPMELMLSPRETPAPTANSEEEQTAMQPDAGEMTTAVRNEAVSDPVTTQPPQALIDVYIYDADYVTGENDFIFRFISPAGKTDLQIRDYCYMLYRDSGDHAAYFDEYETYFQDQFAVSTNGIVYFNGQSTELDNYINGYYMNPDEIVDFPDSENRTAVPYTVTVYVAKDLHAKDIYYYAEKLGNLAFGVRNLLIPAAAVLLLLFLLMWVFLFSAAGYKKGADAPVCGGLHRIPFDLTLLLWIVLCCAAGGITAAVAEEATLLAILLLPLDLMLFLSFFESLAARIRAKTLGRNLLVAMLWRGVKKLGRGCKKLGRRLSGRMNIVWKLGVFYAVSFVLVGFLLMATDAGEAAIIAYVIFKVVELPLLTLGVLNFDLISTGTKKLAEGKTGEKIQSRLLFGEFRKQAEQLNTIDEGINKAVQERLKSESMKTELITNVSHDLKTPLTSIVNYVDLLKKEPINNPKAAEYIEVIDRQSQRLKKLTFDIVDASKAATGNVPMQPEKTDFGMLLGQVLGEYEEKLGERRLQPVQTLPDAPLYIYSDGRLLWRVIDNLMSNICKYSMQGTRVYITLQEQANEAVAVFRNISSGELNISPDELTERFVRGDASRNTEGSGLGLSISKSLTEHMGGRFEIDIDGDLFKVTLRFPRMQ